MENHEAVQVADLLRQPCKFLRNINDPSAEYGIDEDLTYRCGEKRKVAGSPSQNQSYRDSHIQYQLDDVENLPFEWRARPIKAAETRHI